MGGIRRAVVIGVNDYRNEKVEKLSGAVNDATEVRDILKELGNFTIEDKHFLTDDKATCDRCRTAISDLLWKTEECDIALFYFSGHGRRDHFGHGYLLPHDADYAAPFVKGIRIQELKQLFVHAQPKKSCIMILDCCYSGIATQAERSGQEDTAHINSFREELTLEGSGGGRFIWASADADKTAREEERQHALGGPKHVHGVFTFHLIEGLRGGPKDQFGRISLAALGGHLDAAFKGDPKHTPQFSVGAASGAHDIFLTTVAEDLQKRLAERFDCVERLLGESSPTSVMAAIQVLNELEKQGLTSEQIDQCFKQIERMIPDLRTKVFVWWTRNSNGIGIYLKTMKSPWHKLLDHIFSDFELCNLRGLDERTINFVTKVVDVIDQNQDRQIVAKLIQVLDRDDRVVTGEGDVTGSHKATTVVNVKSLPPAGPA